MTDVATPPGHHHDDHLLERVLAFEGQATGADTTAPDPVNVPMIRHWVEAMGDTNPVYLDADAARAAGFSGTIAPPTMLQAWIMAGYAATAERERQRAARSAASPGTSPPAALTAMDELFAILDDAGFTSIVATNCEQQYVRPLVPGDQLTVSSVIETVSPCKRTGLGDGHFVTTRSDYVDAAGDPVATMRFRVLRFRPRTLVTTPTTAPPAPAGGSVPASDRPPLRPRPALTEDNSFFFDGTKVGELRIQRCTTCATLRHPPRPACSECGSLDWDTVVASGRGTVYSFVVVHHPQVPSFDYPLPIAVVELEEGTRLVADLIGVDAGQVSIGMAVEAEMVAVDDDLTLPMFRPAVS